MKIIFLKKYGKEIVKDDNIYISPVLENETPSEKTVHGLVKKN